MELLSQPRPRCVYTPGQASCQQSHLCTVTQPQGASSKPSWCRRPLAQTLLLGTSWRIWRKQRQHGYGHQLGTTRRASLVSSSSNCDEDAPGEGQLRGILPSKCERCNRKLCLCSVLPPKPLDTITRLVLFTHPKEKRRALGSGPLLQLCLMNIIEVVCKEFPEPLEDTALHEKLTEDNRQPFLVYPGPTATQLTPGVRDLLPTSLTLIFIDARWDQARIMLNRSDWLQELPRVSLPSSLQSRYRFRKQPEPGCLSTFLGWV